MTRPVVGWENESPVPNHTFNRYLKARDGRLYLEELDLTQLLRDVGNDQGLGRSLPSPLEIIYLPIIRQQIKRMQRYFAEAMDALDYSGRFYYTYASKANAAEEIIRTTLGAGAHHEMSSTVDVDIARIMIGRNLLTPDRYVICNGFKPAGMDYVKNIITLREQHEKVIPVAENLTELEPLRLSPHHFKVGIRQKSYGPHVDENEMNQFNSRFGMSIDDIWRAAEIIDSAPNLTLKLYHAMVGSQLISEEDFIARLKPPIDIYARLRQRYPSLSIFDFGGGMPVAMTLNFDFDYRQFIHMLLTEISRACDYYRVPVPDVLGEFGRYTTSEHGAHLFKIIGVKENQSDLPWYLIDGSIMSSFPDSWALGEHFIVLPLNHLDKPFRQVQLGGITCDSDDVYPPKKSESQLFLPIVTDDLYIGFFSIGAYQEMLGGVKGSKHCVLPEAYELIIDRTAEGRFEFEVLRGQTTEDVLRNLGYTAT